MSSVETPSTAPDPTAAHPPLRPVIVYGLEDRVPLGPAVLVAAQHVAGMVVGTITPPLLLAATLKFSPEDTASFISVALLASALGALLQCRRRGPLGAGMLSVTGTSFAFLPPLTQAWQAGGIPLMLGMSAATAPLQVALAPFLSKLRRFFPPLVCGIVVLLIGASLIPTAFFGLATPLRAGGSAWPGLGAGAIVIATILAAQATCQAWARIAGVALAIVVGCGVCALAGGLHLPPATNNGWLTIPRWFAGGFTFQPKLILPFAFIYLVSSLEAMGDMTATAQLSGLATVGDAHWRRLSGGVMADGVTSAIAACFGGFPSTTYAQNNGIIQITGVASRRIGYLVAVMLALLGFSPGVARLVTALPPPVFGALALLLFGLVAVSGLRLIASVGLHQREAVIVALALGIGLGLPTQPALLNGLPGPLHALVDSGISAGGLTAIALNLFWPAPKTAP